MKNVAILGGTGSIGRATLEVIAHLKDSFRAFAISTNKNVSLLEGEIEKYNPKIVCITDREAVKRFKPKPGLILLEGKEGLNEIASHPSVDIVVNALVGSIGIYPTIEAIKHGKRLAIANKEVLVAYGEIVGNLAKENNTVILPIDSEHSAIYQALSISREPLKRIILCASGGPFLHKPITADISPEEALSHPVWKMGKKVTVDSSTLMNKGLEIIEATQLFGVPSSKIDVLIHPQSVVHSMVEFVDGSIIAQMSLPDMRLPIQYALTYPKRVPSLVDSLDLEKIRVFEFFPPDFDKFPCLKLAYRASEIGGTMPAVMSASDEVAVNAFLSKKISLPDIPKIINAVMNRHKPKNNPGIEDIRVSEEWSRRETENVINSGSCDYRA
ncbi:MAG TPA: 1-deoxy-D-xylulose-5-phosphate reductoisomerase [bacterium (Candidatus Stahlbacteria)]|nr:1-deoxy-D-xylulose-5-phosphate reductoisomerase [Candidatus Stahlbacteria bacterium]